MSATDQRKQQSEAAALKERVVELRTKEGSVSAQIVRETTKEHD
jgi:hypothetical protein